MRTTTTPTTKSLILIIALLFEQSTDAGTARSGGQDKVLELLRQLVQQNARKDDTAPKKIEAFLVLSKPYDRTLATYEARNSRSSLTRTKAA